MSFRQACFVPCYVFRVYLQDYGLQCWSPRGRGGPAGILLHNTSIRIATACPPDVKLTPPPSPQPLSLTNGACLYALFCAIGTRLSIYGTACPLTLPSFLFPLLSRPLYIAGFAKFLLSQPAQSCNGVI